ncbi:MAG TPA: SHOCT domain-containing protein [Gaiellaceae bacterium]|nr:SHOCT domain-containing protein [Gaiellaceae bacterium]
MVGAIVSTLLAAFVIGLLARWTVPGPDPMPIWMTTGFGLVGALIGNGLVFAIVGTDVKAGSAFAAWFLSVLAATLLVIAHRRFVQHRPITGPGAQRPPASPFGPNPDVGDQLRKLSDLHRDGVLTDEEFEAKKAELAGRP